MGINNIIFYVFNTFSLQRASHRPTVSEYNVTTIRRIECCRDQIAAVYSRYVKMSRKSTILSKSPTFFVQQVQKRTDR
jgi:hypothetical protein